MPKAGAHEVSDPPAIPTASKSQADAKGLSKPTSLRLTLFLSVAILVVAALGIFGALRHDAQLVQLSVKLEEQAAESTKIQRRMGRVAEKAAASNRSIKVLIEDLKEEKKELRQQVRQHHGKLDRLLAKLVVFNGTVTAKHRHGQGEKVLLEKKKEEEEGKDKDEEDEDEETPAKQNSTKSGKKKGKKSDAEDEDDKEDDEDEEDADEDKKRGKKRGRGKKKGRGR